MRRFVLCVLGVVAFAAPAVARQDDLAAAVVSPQTQQKPGSTPQPDKQETAKPAANELAQRGERQLANIRLDVTITDQRATGQPTTKTVSLTLADRFSGRIRTMADVPVQIKTPGGGSNYAMRSVVLNVDGRPELTRDGRIRTEMTLEYRPTGNEPSTDEQSITTISESFTVLLDAGKTLVVSQSADPNTDRRVRVELKATVLK
jgi:hypothetical protein